MRRDRTPTGLTPLVAAIILLGALLGLLLYERSVHQAEVVPVEVLGPEAVLVHRSTFRSAVDALARNDPARAIQKLDSFSFGERSAEPYRLYLLANAYSLAGDVTRARDTLERVWKRNSGMVASTDVAFHLLSLYSSSNDWSRAAKVSGELVDTVESGIVSSTAQRENLIASFYAGNPGAMFRTALDLATGNPDSTAATGTVDLVTALRDREAGQGLTPEERLIRVGHLLDARKASEALELARRIREESLSHSSQTALRLAIGRSLGRLGRYQESEDVLESLFSEQYLYAIPALEASARNQRLLSAAPLPRRISRRERERREKEIGTHRDLYLERLRDLLSLPIDSELRAIILERLIDQAETDENIDRMQRLIRALVRVAPDSDRGLQIMWNQGWLAFEERNDPIAIDRFDFIAETYRDPAIRRQARYWLARSLERVGRTDRAVEIMNEIASAPYEDLYARFARERLGRGREWLQPLPVSNAEDWEVIAERDMPPELRLAWELTLLGQYSAAREEIRRNRSKTNQRFADALLGEGFHADAAWRLANRYLKRAFPSIGTAEQVEVPLHFLRLYYVLPYEEEILDRSRERGLDPAFVAALVHQETTFNAKATSPAGAVGLMQLMPATAREIGQELHAVYQQDRLFDPAFNIDLGTYYVARVMRMMKGDEELAAAGYNGGPYRIRRWLRESTKPKDEFIEGMPLRETRNYVKRVAILRASYRALYPSLRASG